MKRPTKDNIKPGIRLKYIGGKNSSLNRYYTVGKVYIVHDGSCVGHKTPIIPYDKEDGHGYFVGGWVLDHFVFPSPHNVTLGYRDI